MSQLNETDRRDILSSPTTSKRLVVAAAQNLDAWLDTAAALEAKSLLNPKVVITTHAALEVSSATAAELLTGAGVVLDALNPATGIAVKKILDSHPHGPVTIAYPAQR